MAVNNTTLRLTGLASGMDTETMIKQLMTASKAPLNKLYQQKQTMTWKQEGLREINMSLMKLKDKAFDMRLVSKFQVYSATSSDPSIATVKATANAAEGSYAVKVQQLASAATRTSTVNVTAPLTSTADITTPVDLSGTSIKLTFGSVSKEISWAAGEGNYADMTELVNGLQTKINDAFGTNQINVSANGNRLVLESANTNFQQKIVMTNGTTNSGLPLLNFTSGTSDQLNMGTRLADLQLSTGGLTFDVDDKLKFTINGENFAIEKTATLGDLINKVNSNTKANVKLEYNSTKDQFVMTRKDSGAGKDIVVSDGLDSNLFARLSLGAQVDGKNAIYDYTKNGVTTTGMESASNNFSVEGFNFTFVKADTTKEITFSNTKDVDTIFNNIKAFVDQYNETLALVNGKLDEKRYRTYKPLLEDEKADMKDKDIELWEERAKSGMLAGDNDLQRVATNLRSTWNQSVQGLDPNFDYLSEIGIEQGPYYEKGKLTINETKLKAAIASNLDDVMKFFSNTATPVTGNTMSDNVDLTGTDFKINWKGTDRTVSLTGSYDLNTAEGKADLIKELTLKLNGAVGQGNIDVSLNGKNQLMFSTNTMEKFTLVSGASDALATLGLTSGSQSDGAATGLAYRIRLQASKTSEMLVKRAGAAASSVDNSLMGKEMKDLNTRIDAMNEKLYNLENRYYKQFAAMEQAMNRMQQQSSWIGQQMGS